MANDKQALRQQIVAQIERCAAVAYGAGHHFAQHGKHAPSSIMTQADADAKLIHLIEEYAAAGVPAVDATAWERRQGMRVRDGWHWSNWQPCTEAEAQRVSGLHSWQVRPTGKCAACGGTGWVPCLVREVSMTMLPADKAAANAAYAAATAGASLGDGYRTSADGMTRTLIAPDAAAAMVPSASGAFVFGTDGRLRPACAHARETTNIGPTTDQINHYCADCGASWTTFPPRSVPGTKA